MKRKCPKCANELDTVTNDSSSFLLCRTCGGIAVTFSLLKKFIEIHLARAIWSPFGNNETKQ